MSTALEKTVASLAAAMICLSAGCAHVQLRWNTVQQSRTLTDIYEQQVLDNLAMFVCDPNSLPSFAFPTQGASDVMDHIEGSSTTTWDVHGFMQTVLGIGANRDTHEAWTLQPVCDPRRLELMQCAYRQAVASVGRVDDQGCINCDKLERTFYNGSTTGPDAATFNAQTGRTTPACLANEPWFACGCKKCIPKGCGKVGRCGDMYVWVLPGGQDQLTKLTLIILDYASNTPVPPPTPSTGDVTSYYDDKGNPTTKDKAVQVMHATVTLNDQRSQFDYPSWPPSEMELSSDGMRSSSARSSATLPVPQPSQANPAPIVPPNLNPMAPLQLQQNLQFLAPRR